MAARRNAATNGKAPNRKFSPNRKKVSQKEQDQVDLMAKLLSLQEKVNQMENKLEESVKKEEELAQKLEEQVQISEELREEIKEKDEQLEEMEGRLKLYE